jgi:Tol biopolymer transport system component
MAPEQLEGKEADARTDLFALGEVLYEMATGKRAFEGKSQASLIAAILERDPAPISTLAPLTPPALERVIRACLAKEPDERIQTAHDVKLQLQWIAEGGSAVGGVPAVVAHKRKNRERLAWILAGTAGVVAIGTLAALLLRRPPDTRPVRFEIERPGRTADMTWPRLSPDGRWVAFQAVDTSGQTTIWVRPLDAIDARPVNGTEGAQRPFWSPDSRFIGFFADQKLKKVPVDGGPVQLIAQAGGADGTWGARNVILYDNTQTDSVMQVPASGGVPKPASSFDRKEGESGHAWPQFLPDGKHFLFVSYGATDSDVRLKVGELGSFKSKVVLPTGSRGEYAPPGRLVYVLDNNLVSQPFDLGRLQTSGEPVPIAERVNLLGGRENFSTSQVGTIAFQSGGDVPGSELAWIDRAGRRLSVVAPRDAYGDMAFSPDQQQVVVSVINPTNNKNVLWIVDLARGTRARFAAEEFNQVWPVWSPDGQWISYGVDSGGVYQTVRRRADGRGPAEPMGERDKANNTVVSWSPDGRYALSQVRRAGQWDVDLLDLQNGGKRTRFLSSRFDEQHARVSPDGAWVTYASDEGGRYEVFVTSFPDQTGRWQVSLQGGRGPRWSPDGKEIFFVTGEGRFMAASVSTVPRFHTEEPKFLFVPNVPLMGFPQDRILPSRDGKRFLANLSVVGDKSVPITVVVNWMAGRH